MDYGRLLEENKKLQHKLQRQTHGSIRKGKGRANEGQRNEDLMVMTDNMGGDDELKN